MAAPLEMMDTPAPAGWWAVLRLSRNQRSVAHQSALLLAANIVARVLGVARGVVVARLLAPTDYGLLATILVASFYLQLFDFGVGWGTVREIPLLRSKGDTASVARLEREVFWWEVVVGLTVGLVTFGYLAAHSSRPGFDTRAWMFVPVYVAAELLRNTQQCFLQARESFGPLRRSMIWQAIVDLVLAVIFTRVWGLRGAAAALALTSVSVAIYMIVTSGSARMWVPARMRGRTFRMLMAVGFPLMVQNLMWANMTNVDKLVILSKLSTESLAYYAMAQTVAASLLLVSGAATRVNGPVMIRRFGETGEAASLYGMLFKTLIVLTYGLPVLVAGIWLAGPLFFTMVLPKYGPSIPLLDFSSVAFYAMAVTIGASSLYVALERQVLNGALLLGGMALTVAIGLWLIHRGEGTMGVAIASALSSGAYLIAFVGFALSMVGRTGRRLVRDMVIVLLPLGWCAAAATGLQRLSHTGTQRLGATALILCATAALAAGGMKMFVHAEEWRA
jgi:O-antigen/teichoic acid export membrane protein